MPSRQTVRFSLGSNTDGRLGLGTTTNVRTPVQVGTVNTWSKVEIGLGFATAIRTDGSLWGWGFNTRTIGYGRQ
jgi:alpha-tubulin suppressor-like RCC1 family protein